MASIQRERRKGKTYYRVWWYDKNNDRKSIRLGAINAKAANAIKVKVESLVSASIGGNGPDPKTTRWLASIGKDLADKLTVAGLGQYISKRESTTLKTFTDDYIASRSDAKPSTIRGFRATQKALVNYFGPDVDLRDIRPGDADDWRQSLVQAGLAESTIAKLV